MVFIDSLYVIFSYVDKQGEIWTVSFSLTKDQVKKKLHHTKSWLFYVLDIDDSDEGCTVGCELLYVSIKILYIILDLKKKNSGRKNGKDLPPENKTWTFSRQYIYR